VQRKNDQDNSRLPSDLLRPTPRHVRLKGCGIFVLALLAALILGGLWGGTEIYRRANLSERHVALFASEGVSTAARVVRVQRRGGGNDRRSTVHYRYVVGDREYAGATTVRRVDRDRYEPGSQIAVRYLSSEPRTSWKEGYAPRRQPIWPAFVLPAGAVLVALALAAQIRRQSRLLTYGRPAVATVTKVEKKRSDKGTYWRVHYEWTLLSGGKRQGRYNHGKKLPPAVGTTIPIVYDRDQPSRHGKYPLSLVAVSRK
jgi:hypothetical protein